MSVKISAKYLGEKRVEIKHGPSGTSLITDAPVDNNGKGESFSPTDLVASALGACAMTIMGIVAEKDEIDLSGMEMTVEKSMSASPRRIASLPVSINMPSGLSSESRKKLEAAARACPVHKSLASEVEASLKFNYPD